MTAPDEWATRWIRGAMALAGINASELARRRGVTPTNISRVLMHCPIVAMPNRQPNVTYRNPPFITAQQ